MIGHVQEEFARLAGGLDDAVPMSMQPSHRAMTDVLVAVREAIYSMNRLRGALDTEREV